MSKDGAETASEGVARCRLCLVTPSLIDPEAFAPRLEAALAAADVACVRLRLPGAEDAALRRATAILMPVCHARDVAFLLDDRPDIAAAMKADGAHLGAADAYWDARAELGSAGIVGVDCGGSRHRGFEAAEMGADYVAFGALFPPAAAPYVDRDLLRDWCETMTVPCVAAGGITLANAAALVAVGVEFLAVGRGIWQHVGGAADAVAAFNRIIDGGLAAAPDGS